MPYNNVTVEIRILFTVNAATVQIPVFPSWWLFPATVSCLINALQNFDVQHNKQYKEKESPH